ncbi:MAG: malate synthase G, partial [Xanthomonadales bacterium]|nr:malate synthase G [Xanthomonadales bacterium]
MDSTDQQTYPLRGDALSVHPAFLAFVEQELLPAAGLEAEPFWRGLEALLADLAPRNRELLARRAQLQEQIDAWHRERSGEPWDHDAYTGLLEEIGYLAKAGAPFRISTENVDAEIAGIAGPQLVVPVSNARFALNAANARWGSLYDALYGSDVIDEQEGREPGRGYNPVRGAAVIAHAARFLDQAIPLATGSHADVISYELDTTGAQAALVASLPGGALTRLADPGQFKAYAADGKRQDLLFRHHGLHIELRIDPSHPVGRDAPAHVSDVVLEAALTTIQDCEDSVAAVDAEDKVGVYRNWLGLMRGTLEARFRKGGETRTRTLAADRVYTSVGGGQCTLPGRSLMLVRNTGLLMTTDAVRDGAGAEVFEGLLDAVVTAACAMANARQQQFLPNSRHGSIYIVKPKLHGPDEAAFTNRLFDRVEDLLGLQRNTVKVGIMDEERRTTVNLAECIRAVRERLVFINTGFLDRTGDEIHTSMHAGPVMPKGRIKDQP